VDVDMHGVLGSGTWVSRTTGQTIGLGGYVKVERGFVGMLGTMKMKMQR
jgi:hypothetical protein